MGPQCAGLRVLLRVATLETKTGGPDQSVGRAGGRAVKRKVDLGSADHEATWLLGHTERITFLGDLRRDGRDLFQEAVLHVPCKYLRRSEASGLNGVGTGPESCGAHGYTRPVPRRASPGPDPAEPRCFPGDRFRIVDRAQAVTRVLPPPIRPPRELPIHAGSNPCVGAACRTADNTRGAACCRDLQVEIMCTPGQRRLEALVRSRQSPYLCKVERAHELLRDLGVRFLSGGWGALRASWPAPSGRKAREARPLQRVAGGGRYNASGVRVRGRPVGPLVETWVDVCKVAPRAASNIGKLLHSCGR